MLRLQAYKYEILPNGEQERRMRRCAGSCRFVFNKALALQKERYDRGEQKLSYGGLCKLLTQWRNGTETPWAPSIIVAGRQSSYRSTMQPKMSYDTA